MLITYLLTYSLYYIDIVYECAAISNKGQQQSIISLTLNLFLVALANPILIMEASDIRRYDEEYRQRFEFVIKDISEFLSNFEKGKYEWYSIHAQRSILKSKQHLISSIPFIGRGELLTRDLRFRYYGLREMLKRRMNSVYKRPPRWQFLQISREEYHRSRFFAEYSQIEKDTPVIEYLTPSADEECPICLDLLANDQMATTKCGHIYHRKCITESFVNFGKVCPYCRDPTYVESFSIFNPTSS